MKHLTAFSLYAIQRHPAMIIITVIIATAAVLFSAGLFGLASWLILFCALQPSFELVMVPVVGVRFFGIARAGTRYLERLISHDVTFRVLRDLRVDFYLKMEPRLPDLSFHQNRGSLIARAVSDVETLQDGFLRILYPAATALLIVFCGVVFLGSINQLLGMIFGIAGLAVFFGSIFMTMPITGLATPLADVKNRLYGSMIETTHGALEIILNARQNFWISRFATILSKENALESRIALHASASSALAGAYPSFLLLLTLAAAALLVSTESIPPILIAIVPLMSAALCEALSPLFIIPGRIDKSDTAAQRVISSPENSSFFRNSSGQPVSTTEPKTLSIANLSFGYLPHRTILTNVSFKAYPGKIALLTGSSGCGKSTLVDLVTGFIDRYTGSIHLNSIDIREMAPDTIRQHISVIEQQPFFFNDTIRANLLIADPSASDEKIAFIIEIVNLKEMIEGLPKKIDTQMSELGANFSGGEKRRLAIARALLKDAPILIADEPTADLDAVNEQHIFQILHERSQMQTVLLISHRPLPAHIPHTHFDFKDFL